MTKSAEKGFTLAELLIALGILGVIAAFTIPKVLQATGTAQNNAAAKDAISTLEQSWYNLKLQSQYLNNTTLYGNLVGNANANSSLNLAQQGPGAPPAAFAASPCGAAVRVGYIVFQNGTLVTGLAAAGTTIPATGIANNMANGVTSQICIDTNGNAGPNQSGTDVFKGNFNPSGVFLTGGANPTNATASTNKNFFWGDPATATFQTFPFAAAGTAVAGATGGVVGTDNGAGILLQ